MEDWQRREFGVREGTRSHFGQAAALPTKKTGSKQQKEERKEGETVCGVLASSCEKRRLF